MEKKIRGIVLQNPIALEKCCLFAVEQNENIYLILSTDTQATKDNIFVEQGQEICISGNGIEDVDMKGIIITEQAHISIEADFKGLNDLNKDY